MTIQVDAADFATAVEVASWVASMVAMLIMGLIVYFMVRPSRRSRQRRDSDAEALQLEEMVQLMERMERRLETLERAIRDEHEAPRILETGAERAEYGRTK
jgi:phage shock protein B